jgi:hypothetical protein
MTGIRTIFCSGALMLAGSCTDVVQVELDEGSKMYVIDAFLGNSSVNTYIRITTSFSYFSGQTVPFVENAKVVLKDLTRSATYPFESIGSGIYQYSFFFSDKVSQVGHQYQLDVTIEGVTYTALATQKRPAVIDSITSTYYEQNNPLDPDKNPYYLCTLWARDKADNDPDYYWIKVYGKNIPADINICIDGTNGVVKNAPRDTMPFGPPATLMGLKKYTKDEPGSVEIYSITHETYEFFVQAASQITNGGLFAKTPENLKTNIVSPAGATKAVGWFSMSSVAEKTFVVH